MHVSLQLECVITNDKFICNFTYLKAVGNNSSDNWQKKIVKITKFLFIEKLRYYVI